MLRMKQVRRATAQGFTLVELMVALVSGLIVIGAVLALVLALMKSNRETLQSTRLNQELRATINVIANDLRRARSVADPLSTAVLPSPPYKDVDTSTAGCVIFAYDGAVGGPWHVIRLAGDKVVLQAAATKPASCTSITGTPTPFGSAQVAVTELTFSPATTALTSSATRKFDITITGHLVDTNSQVASVSRTITQSIYVRSIGAGS